MHILVPWKKKKKKKKKEKKKKKTRAKFKKNRYKIVRGVALIRCTHCFYIKVKND